MKYGVLKKCIMEQLNGETNSILEICELLCDIESVDCPPELLVELDTYIEKLSEVMVRILIFEKEG